MMLTPKSQLELLQNKDHDEISQVVRTYTNQLLRASLGLGFDPNMAKELVQSVWVSFFEGIEKFEGRSQVRTFLFGILYNKAAEVRRFEKRFDRSDPIEEIMERRFGDNGSWVKPPMNPEEFLLASQSLDVIKECLDALPLSQRMAFALREIEEKETDEICKVLEVTVTNLGVLMYRARNRLRECIEDKAGKQ